jgi:hypothetical protein
MIIIYISLPSLSSFPLGQPWIDLDWLDNSPRNRPAGPGSPTPSDTRLGLKTSIWRGVGRIVQEKPVFEGHAGTGATTVG